jgi:hypothetical protein
MQKTGDVKDMTNQANTAYVDLLYNYSNDQNIKNIGNFSAGIFVSAMLFPNNEN